MANLGAIAILVPLPAGVIGGYHPALPMTATASMIVYGGPKLCVVRKPDTYAAVAAAEATYQALADDNPTYEDVYEA